MVLPMSVVDVPVMDWEQISWCAISKIRVSEEAMILSWHSLPKIYHLT
jgi:hypothetical protein